MLINNIGGGWVTAENYGQMRNGTRPVLHPGTPKLPPAQDLFSPLPARFRRFDLFTQLGLSAIALALKDAGIAESEHSRSIGIVISSVYECFEVDLAYYQTTLDEDGLFASPNLFSYTLPGIVTGEAAIYFKLTGPTFTMGDDTTSRGMPALLAGVDMIRSGMCKTVICGWLDSPGEMLETKLKDVDPVCGAVFVVLSAEYQQRVLAQLRIENSALLTASGAKLESIQDLC